MNYLLYLVYGSGGYTQEALYSLISYYRLHIQDENQVVIYTDDPAPFKKLLPDTVIYIPLTAMQLQEWKGGIDFNHRIKIKAIEDACTRFTGNILYIDTDTYFTKNISGLFKEISNKAIIFHKSEGRLIDNPGGIAAKTRKFLKQHNLFALKSQEQPVKLDSKLEVWNAGTIGFNSQYNNNLVLVEELTDALYSKYALFVMEQIAFSYVFGRITSPKPAEDYIHHYWYFKEFKTVLKHFFTFHEGKSLPDLQIEIDKINPEHLSTEKRTYKKMSFWKKQFTRLTKGRKWKIADYTL